MDLTPRQDDHEAKMARADLFKLAQYSFKLFKMIHEDQELEGWVQAKITKAADYIASVYHYMEYEMKFSEYGEQLENSDMFQQMPESQRIAIESMLTEAKETMKKLTAAQAKKLKKKDDKVEEGWDDMMKAVKDRSGPQPNGGSGVKKGSRYGGSKQVDAQEKDDEDEKPKKSKKVKEATKPDFLDMDKDGNKKEPMKKAINDKKVKESFPTVADAKARHEKDKGTGKFDKKEVGDGRTQYTRKASTFTDGGDDSDTKAAKKKEKKVKEAAKAKKDYDGDGKIESGKDEYLGSKIAAAKKAGKMAKEGYNPNSSSAEHARTIKANIRKDMEAKSKEGDEKAKAWLKRDDARKERMRNDYNDRMERESVEEAAKCNHSAKGKSCPVHGMKECSGMYEAERKAAVKPSTGLSAAKKSSIVKKAKAGGDIGKPGKGFAALASKAGGGEKGTKIAAAAMWKNAAKESVELKPVVVAESVEMARLKQLNKILNG